MRNAPLNQSKNQLRIIGGKWRSRKFSFPPITDIRPTPNRIRETLFNWLAPVINGAHCLDLFAGSGSLGLEALSRGAASVIFIDNHREVAHHLQKTIEIFNAENAKIMLLDIPSDNFIAEKKFDIVFLDPPFAKNMIQSSCEWLEQKKLLTKNACIYIEAEKDLGALPIPLDWELMKRKVAGQVGYHLFTKRKK